ncbi:Uncharacterised protein [Mycobacteroides abscessus subsp. abscessus]|nr:Uncharacterised protein [Mycobacteroides abscessus subsp. abscessus]SHX45942.1 Uncharacterised protein [Mycobacteroides abscessus subsp. abscessus]SIA80726.1 Uncharacterised protein [Mycobacteroides abscessus subsp. abscessus]SKL01700.1 Uncharacterised protein [Mycobacteroides abscessus subsp. abscessus]SKT88437.1 Uncharacterised protein [Mycobacteroides abscessus subsp. abscessus]
MLGKLPRQRQHLSGDSAGRLLGVQVSIEITDQPEGQLP